MQKRRQNTWQKNKRVGKDTETVIDVVLQESLCGTLTISNSPFAFVWMLATVYLASLKVPWSWLVWVDIFDIFCFGAGGGVWVYVLDIVRSSQGSAQGKGIWGTWGGGSVCIESEGGVVGGEPIQVEQKWGHGRDCAGGVVKYFWEAEMPSTLRA